MSFHAYEVLGPAEKHVADELRAAVAAAKTAAQKILDQLDQIDTDHIEDALVDVDRKKAIITLVDPLQKLAGNLAMAELTPLLVSVMLRPRDITAS